MEKEKKSEKVKKNGFFHFFFLLIICLFFRIKFSKAVFSRSFSKKSRFFSTSSLFAIETLRLCKKLLSFFIELLLCSSFIGILFDSLIIIEESFTTYYRKNPVIYKRKNCLAGYGQILSINPPFISNL